MTSSKKAFTAPFKTPRKKQSNSKISFQSQRRVIHSRSQSHPIQGEKNAASVISSQQQKKAPHLSVSESNTTDPHLYADTKTSKPQTPTHAMKKKTPPFYYYILTENKAQLGELVLLLHPSLRQH